MSEWLSLPFWRMKMDKKKDGKWEIFGASVHPLSHRLEFRGGVKFGM